jgi:hypothetical protein
MKKVELLMGDLSDFIKAIDIKNSYEEFIEDSGDEIDDVVNDLYSCFKDSFYEGWRKGRENGEQNGMLKLRLEIAINMIKYSNLDDDTILEILGKKYNEKHWIDFLKKTREEMGKG